MLMPSATRQEADAEKGGIREVSAVSYADGQRIGMG